MIVCFATDLHGRVNLYDQLAGLACKTNTDLIIFGGDMLPDGEMELPCRAQLLFVTDWLADWLRRLRRQRPACRVATVFGNHDWACSAHATENLEAEGLLTILRPDRPVSVGQWQVAGYSYAPPSPFWSKDFERLDRPGDRTPLADGARWDPVTQTVLKAGPEYFSAQPSIQDDLAEIPHINGPWMFVAHAPPFGLGLDLLITGEAVGSHAVREFIERRQPPISLHGHLHDSPYKSGRFYRRIGKTVAINPGQGIETLAAVTFDPADAIGTMTAHGIRLPGSESKPQYGTP
jgi:Icc-related predicted phosphoesterase